MTGYSYIFTLSLCLAFYSCGRITNRTEAAFTETTHRAKEKAADWTDTLFPRFDADHADTKYNKRRFAEYLEVDLTADISEIFCCGDFLGADYTVLFSFTCDSATVLRIIEKKGMQKSPEPNDNGLVTADRFDWWDAEKTARIQAYKSEKESDVWQYLWYDKENQKAYYEQFSL